MRNPVITLAQAHRAMGSRGECILNFHNKQTQLTYSFKVEQSDYDPMDPFSSALPPQFVYNQIGDGEWVYMGALYNGNDYLHYEEGVFPTDYPCVKVFRFMLKSMIIDKAPAHIEITKNEILTEDYVDRLVSMTCEQVSNLQYGNITPKQGLINGDYAKTLAGDFIKAKNTNQMHNFYKRQIQ